MLDRTFERPAAPPPPPPHHRILPPPPADLVTSPFVPVDLHAHTTMSDGALAPADLVTVVRGRGVRPSVADHLSRDVTSAVKTVVGVRSYLDELESHPGLLRGGEF